MDPLWRRVELDDLLPGLRVAPQPHCALEERTLLAARYFSISCSMRTRRPAGSIGSITIARSRYLRPSPHTVLDWTAATVNPGDS